MRSVRVEISENTPNSIPNWGFIGDEFAGLAPHGAGFESPGDKPIGLRPSYLA